VTPSAFGVEDANFFLLVPQSEITSNRIRTFDTAAVVLDSE